MPGTPARLLRVALLALLLGAACAPTPLMATRALTDEERCVQDRGLWRVDRCEPCGGGL